MQSNLISVIIPFHNNEQYLERCIDSVITQEYKYFEIILVDDGSTDNSLQLAQKYETQDERVKVIHQSNQGVSEARNTGIKNAHGKYIMFLDADDYFLPALSSVLANQITNDLIVLSFEAGNNQKISDNRIYSIAEIEKAQVLMLENPTKYMTVWSKIFNREIITQNQLSFDSKLRVAEDGDFMIQYLLNCHTIQFRDVISYHYSNETTSVMTTFDNHKSQDYLKALQVSAKRLITASAALQKAFAVYVMMHLNIIMVHETFASANEMTYNEKVNELKDILKEPLFKTALNEIKINECTEPRMVPILLLKLKLYYLVSFLFVLRAKQNEKRVK